MDTNYLTKNNVSQYINIIIRLLINVIVLLSIKLLKILTYY